MPADISNLILEASERAISRTIHYQKHVERVERGLAQLSNELTIIRARLDRLERQKANQNAN